MKTVAQTVIEADHFYTIAAHTGNVIQAVEGTKEAGTVRLGKYEHKPEQEWSFIRVGDGVYRIRNRASGKLLDLSDVDCSAHPGRNCAPALFLGRRQVRGHRWHGRCGWHRAADLAGGVRRR